MGLISPDRNLSDFSPIWNEVAFENVMGKGGSASCQGFLLFPQCSLPFERQKKWVKVY